MSKYVVIASLLLAACAEKQPVMAKKPNTELISGDFERHLPEGETAIRFVDHNYRVAKTRMQFDANPALAEGTYSIEGDKLTLSAQKGACADPKNEQTGVYKVVISRIGIHFTKVSDACERRRLDGQTWWRIQ